MTSSKDDITDDEEVDRTIINNNDDDDQELIKQAKIHYQEEQLLEAARLLRKVSDHSLINDDNAFPHHKRLLENANVIEKAADNLLQDPIGNDWKILSHHHHDRSSNYDTTIYTKFVKKEEDQHQEEEEGQQRKKHRKKNNNNNIHTLSCRIESPVPSNLLVPLLSVLNESSLYHTWIPSWKHPFQIGICHSQQLYKASRGHQIIQIQFNFPWPLKSKEILMDVTAVDDIDSQGLIIAKTRTIQEDSKATNLQEFDIPELPKNMERGTDFDGALLFRRCPTDHPNYESSKSKFVVDVSSSEEEDLILLQYTISFDIHMVPLLIPKGLINFITKTVIGRIWSMLLQVAEEVRDGTTRPEHIDIIQQNSEFYNWIEQRCSFL